MNKVQMGLVSRPDAGHITAYLITLLSLKRNSQAIKQNNLEEQINAAASIYSHSLFFNLQCFLLFHLMECLLFIPLFIWFWISAWERKLSTGLKTYRDILAQSGVIARSMVLFTLSYVK